jgi:type II secretory pathway pseudopilin PulG
MARPTPAGKDRAAARTGRRAPPRRAAGGFTYLGVLFLVVLLGLGLSGAGQLWSIASQRAKEKELLWVGQQYAKALKAYYDRSPGSKRYPLQLDELLQDRRFPTTVRYLRQLYRDPLTNSAEWGLVKTPDGHIAGIYSLAEGTPLKQVNFPLAWEEFAGMQSYQEWRFVADPALRTPRATPSE